MNYYYYTYFKKDTVKHSENVEFYEWYKESYTSKLILKTLIPKLTNEDTLLINSINDLGLNLKTVMTFLNRIENTGCQILMNNPKVESQRDYKVMRETLETLNNFDNKLATYLISTNMYLQDSQSTLNPTLYNPRKFTPNKRFISIYTAWRQGGITAKDAAKLLNMSRATFFRYVENYEKSQCGVLDGVKMGE